MSSMIGSTPYGTSGRSGNKVAKGYQLSQLQNFSPQQQQLFSQLFGQVGPDSYLSKLAGGAQSQFEALERPALKQFSALQGGLASRFSGMGSFGNRNSSGFQNTANAAASDFAGQLQSNRLNLQRQAIMDLSSMSNQLLQQRPFENQLTQKQTPFWQKLLEGLASNAAQFGTQQAGNAAMLAML